MVSSKENLNDHLSDEEKLREAEKMIAEGIPIEIICRILRMSPTQLQDLRQSGEACFK